MPSCVYLDANGTTIMPQRVLNEMIKWSTRGNPSSLYPSARAASKMVDIFREELADRSNFSLVGPAGYTILFTGGGSEANSTIITSTIRSFIKLTNKRPHIITSSVEHDNIMLLIKDLEEEGVDFTLIDPETMGPNLGSVNPESIAAAIRPNTCLITIMSANNETGIKNDIQTIGKIAESYKIPFHTDAVQIFGKYPINPDINNITSFSGSFHKLHGPTGLGILVIKNSFIGGYQLKPIIHGHQNYGMRGGTECIHNIAAAREAYKMSFEDREKKNNNMKVLREYMINQLKNRFSTYTLDNFNGSVPCTDPPPIVFITPTSSPTTGIVPNTLLISVYHKNICNTNMREKLANHNIYVSIGSACKTGDKKSSHVLRAMNVPKELFPGVIRISLNDFSIKEEIDYFIEIFTHLIKTNQCLRIRKISSGT